MKTTSLYPHEAGYKTDETETSQAAACAIKPDAFSLRQKCLAALRGARLTADEVAELLGIDRLAIRPRLSELNALNQIVATTERRKNASGKSAVVWAAVTPMTQGDLL